MFPNACQPQEGLGEGHNFWIPLSTTMHCVNRPDLFSWTMTKMNILISKCNWSQPKLQVGPQSTKSREKHSWGPTYFQKDKSSPQVRRCLCLLLKEPMKEKTRAIALGSPERLHLSCCERSELLQAQGRTAHSGVESSGKQHCLMVTHVTNLATH